MFKHFEENLHFFNLLFRSIESIFFLHLHNSQANFLTFSKSQLPMINRLYKNLFLIYYVYQIIYYEVRWCNINKLRWLFAENVSVRITKETKSSCCRIKFLKLPQKKDEVTLLDAWGELKTHRQQQKVCQLRRAIFSRITGAIYSDFRRFTEMTIPRSWLMRRTVTRCKHSKHDQISA